MILVASVPATQALMQATKSIPIVMAGVANLVELGIVLGFVKPGGNITGSSFLGNEIAGKLLQLLKEAAPRLRSVAVFVNPTNGAVAQFVPHFRAADRMMDRRAFAGTSRSALSPRPLLLPSSPRGCRVDERLHVLIGKLCRPVATRCELRKQDPQRNKAADLPVEQPTKFDLFVNAMTAGAGASASLDR